MHPKLVADTSVASRCEHQDQAASLFIWVHRADIYIPSIVLAEMEYGASLEEYRGRADKAATIRREHNLLIDRFRSRILPFDGDGARRAGRIKARAELTGTKISFADAAIAAIAEQFGMWVLTYNRRHFSATGIPFITFGQSLAPLFGQLQLPFALEG